MKDRRIKNPKTVPPLNIPYYSPAQKVAKGVGLLTRLMTKTGRKADQFPGTRGARKR